DHRLRGALHVDGAAIVAESLPEADYLGGGSIREIVNGRERIEPTVVVGDNAIDLGLLKHDLGDHDPVGVTSMAPREIATVDLPPGEKMVADGGSFIGGNVDGHVWRCAMMPLRGRGRRAFGHSPIRVSRSSRLSVIPAERVEWGA